MRIGCVSAHAHVRMNRYRFSRAGSWNGHARIRVEIKGRPEMANYDITCSRKDGPDDDQRLEGLGGADWYHTIDQVIANITRGDTYWVNNGKRVQVAVLTHPQ